jgi:hypothetical protein
MLRECGTALLVAGLRQAVIGESEVGEAQTAAVEGCRHGLFLPVHTVAQGGKPLGNMIFLEVVI